MTHRSALAVLATAVVLAATPFTGTGPADATVTATTAVSSGAHTPVVTCSRGLLRRATQGAVRFSTTLDGTTARLTASAITVVSSSGCGIHTSR